MEISETLSLVLAGWKKTSALTARPVNPHLRSCLVSPLQLRIFPFSTALFPSGFVSGPRLLPISTGLNRRGMNTPLLLGLGLRFRSVIERPSLIYERNSTAYG